MACVYILESEKNGRFYIGSTTNLNKRIQRHNAGAVHTTKRFIPLKLVFKQEFPNINYALRIEYRLKKLKRKDYLQKIIKTGKICLRNQLCAYSSAG